MTPLPAPLGDGPLTGWRIDRAEHAESWDSGEGAFLFPGRWHPKGFRCVYAAIDPATAILEVAVHKGFDALDTQPHVLTSFTVIDPTSVRVVRPEDVPNPVWLTPAAPSPQQRDWGKALMQAHAFVILPSVVSPHSWNILFEVRRPSVHTLLAQDRHGLDTRLAQG